MRTTTDRLPLVRTDVIDGRPVHQYGVPFRVAPKPTPPSGFFPAPRRARVAVAELVATQLTVSSVGLKKHAAGGDPPLVYRCEGESYIIDGHHRSTAAYLRGDFFIDAMVVEFNPGYRERLPGGLAAGRRPADFDAKQFAFGTRVELEHTARDARRPTRSEKELAREIAMDHLVEDPRYYKALAKMEKQLQRTRRNPTLGQTLGVQTPSYDETYAGYRSAYEETLRQINDLVSRYGKAVLKAKHGPELSSAFDVFIIGRTLSEIIVRERVVPDPKRSLFNKAHAEFHRARRPPNFMKWFVSKIKLAQVLLDSNSWYVIGRADPTVRELGDIRVINQTGRDPDATMKLIETSVDAMRRSTIAGIDGVLYGNVYFVGEILGGRAHAAMYRRDTDDIQVVLANRFETSVLKSIIHEFGHRYWQLVFGDRNGWTVYHEQLAGEIKLPAVGDRLEIVRGEDKPRVVAVRRGRIFFEGNKEVSTRDYFRVMRNVVARDRFPTRYAATDPEEHFCEAFALFCLGELKEPHQANFEAFVRRDRPRDLAAARRLLSEAR